MKIQLTNIRKLSFRSIQIRTFMVALLCWVTVGCEEDLPDTGSIPDPTPPSADFSFTADEGNYKTLSFTNTSISASDFLWDFGDGSTSGDKEPEHTYAEDGTYEISLTASDKLGKDSTITQSVEIKEPEVPFTPTILNPGFDIQGDDDYRDHWRNADLGEVIQITSSPVHQGEKAAKFPSAGDRIAYQLITVEANKDYIVSFYYTMKTSPAGSLKVAILAGETTDEINAVTVNDQSNSSEYVLASVSFNSGPNTKVAIFVTNEGVECRVDTFTIVPD